MSHHNHTLIEYQIAWELIAITADQLELHLDIDDIDAAIIAVLATAIELASQRKLKPINEIYQPF
jgi:hypothetical protein